MDKSTTLFVCVFFLLVLVNLSQSCPQIWQPVKSPLYLENYANILNDYLERGLFKSSWDQVGNVSNGRIKRDDQYSKTHLSTSNKLVERSIELIRNLLNKIPFKL